MAQEKNRRPAFRSMNVNPNSQSQLLNGKIKEMQNKIKILETSNSELKQQRDKSNQQNQMLKHQISQKYQIEKRNSQLQSKNFKLNDKIKQYQQKLRNASKEKQEIQKSETLKDQTIDKSIELKQQEIKLKQNEERVKRIQKMMKDWKIKALGLQMDLTKQKQQHIALKDQYKEQISQYKEKAQQIIKLQNDYKSKILTLSKQMKQQKINSIPSSQGQSDRFELSDHSSQLKLELGKISGQLEKTRKLLNQRETLLNQLKIQREGLFKELKKSKEEIQSLNSQVTQLYNEAQQHRFGESLNSSKIEIEDHKQADDNNAQLDILLQNSAKTIEKLKKTISEQDEQLDKRFETNSKLELEIQRLKRLIRNQEFYIDKLKTQHHQQSIKSRGLCRNINSTWDVTSNWNVCKNVQSQMSKEQVCDRQNKGYRNETKNRDIGSRIQQSIIQKDQQQQ